MQYYIAFTLNAILMWQYFYLGPVRPSSKHHGQGRSGRAGHDAQKDTSAHGKAREGAGRDKGVREGGGRETGGPASRTRSKGT